MNTETQLKIQALVDRELSESEAHAVAQLLEQDAEARTLHEALKATRKFLAENEPEHALPESREFYWSKIERQILREPVGENQSSAPVTPWNWWLKFGLAFGCVAALAVLVLTNPRPVGLTRSSSLQEIESLNEDDDSDISFHSESEGITVVWVKTQFN